MRTVLTGCCAIALAAGSVAPVHAGGLTDTITYHYDATPDTVVAGPSTTSEVEAVALMLGTLPEFDPAFGILTEVRFAMSAESIFAIHMPHSGGGTAFYGGGTAPADGSVDLTVPGPGPDLFEFGPVSGSVMGGSPTPTDLFLPLSLAASHVWSSPDDLDNFYGDAAYSVHYRPTTSIHPAGPDTSVALRLVSYHFEVTYTYAVPEPATAGLACLGALLILRRRPGRA